MSNEVTDANRWSALTLGDVLIELDDLRAKHTRDGYLDAEAWSLTLSDVIARSRRKADEQTEHAEALLTRAHASREPKERTALLHARGFAAAEVGHALVMLHAAERELATLAKRGGR